ncbi:coiled-coil domain-containing protein 94 [Phalaenopsis equestris]|uniref:coiled-coil domain-containing protein 94 n=1 Tax=Phalaenopsis equestris TaxID=78828 RepID=UPI0009E3BEC5|nr:coiled-coil domain-containing protein 94 [Phalaenopsis equestris]XP_020587499.1 coiled-coil domain-containing protein 94 [Phalaenopsis equestris]
MGERKVLNKYYPPDFDPAKIPRRRQLKNQQMKVRMMLPMSIRCATCGTYIYKGTKFNSRKEDVIGETYLGIPIFRFYFKCTKCSAELTIKTDPQNSDYVVESGASRNFEPWRGEEEAMENEKKRRETEELGDAMKSLENRAIDSKQDMDILSALEEMRSMKSRHATVSYDVMLETLKRSAYEKEKKIMEELDAADEEIIKSIAFHGSKDFVRRINDDEDDDMDDDLPSLPSGGVSELNLKRKGIVEASDNPTDVLSKASIPNDSKGSSSVSIKPKFMLKPRSSPIIQAKKQCVEFKETAKIEIANRQSDDGVEDGQKSTEGVVTTNILQSLFQNYGSDESE